MVLRAQRAGGGCSVLHMNLGKFRPVKDAHSHAVGDKLLQQEARGMRKCVGATDTVTRLAGYDFVVLLDGPGNRQDAVAVARKLVREISRPSHVEGRELDIPTSAGMAL